MKNSRLVTIFLSLLLVSGGLAQNSFADKNIIQGNCYLRQEYNYFMDQWTTNEICEPTVREIKTGGNALFGWVGDNKNIAPSDVYYVNSPSRTAQGGTRNSYTQNQNSNLDSIGYYTAQAWNKSNNMNLSGFSTPYSAYNASTFYWPNESYYGSTGGFRWADLLRAPGYTGYTYEPAVVYEESAPVYDYSHSTDTYDVFDYVGETFDW